MMLFSTTLLIKPPVFSAEGDNELEELEKGMADEAVIELEEDLKELGFTSIEEPTEEFDEDTKQSIKSFQSYFDLEVDGKANEETLNKIDDVLSSPFQEGEYHEETVKLKEMLSTLGYWDTSNVTTLYDSHTETAVQEFQADNDLPQSGIVDEVTLESLEVLVDEPLRNRMRREDVIPLKENLQHLGYGSFNMTDLFATATEAAVRAFQSDYQDYYDLSVNGIADSDTVSALEEIANTQFQNRNSHSETRNLKDYLYVLGFWDSKDGTNLYGNRSEQAVREFQSSNNLLETGIADPITWDVLEKKATAPLQNRMYRDDVIPLKEKLELLGFGSFNMTDLFASQTERAVREFQSYYQDYYDLTVSGVVDNKNLAILAELVNSPFQDENRHEYTKTLKDQMNILVFWYSSNVTSIFDTRTILAN